MYTYIHAHIHITYVYVPITITIAAKPAQRSHTPSTAHIAHRIQEIGNTNK